MDRRYRRAQGGPKETVEVEVGSARKQLHARRLSARDEDTPDGGEAEQDLSWRRFEKRHPGPGVGQPGRDGVVYPSLAVHRHHTIWAASGGATERESNLNCRSL